MTSKPIDILDQIDQAIAWERALSAPADHAISVLLAARSKIERMRAERLELDRRIHNQRRACRETWEIVEMRQRWMGSSKGVRDRFYALRERARTLQARLDLHLSGSKRTLYK